MEKSESIVKLAEALSKAQAQMQSAKKDSANPFFKSTYADLASVWDAIRQPLTNNGLSVAQPLSYEDEAVIIETILMHSSGEWLSGKMKITPAKKDAQGYGAVISYMRRYSLQSIIGACAEDDDGETDRKAHLEKPSIKPPQALSDPLGGKDGKAEYETTQSKKLSLAELIDKMTTAENDYELKARWEKYAADRQALPAADQSKITIAKNKRKAELAKQPQGTSQSDKAQCDSCADMPTCERPMPLVGEKCTGWRAK